jgi:hypothetical protein
MQSFGMLKQLVHTVTTIFQMVKDRMSCKSYTYKNSFRTSQETHYVSGTETNRLMLFWGRIAVCCENDTETQIQCMAVRTLQETHYLSATEHNRFLQFGETVAVYC